jgi:hypothetical protein
MASVSAPFKKDSSITRYHLYLLFLRNAILVLIFTFPFVSQSISLGTSSDYLSLKTKENNFIKDNQYYKEKVPLFNSNDLTFKKYAELQSLLALCIESLYLLVFYWFPPFKQRLNSFLVFSGEVCFWLILALVYINNNFYADAEQTLFNWFPTLLATPSSSN